MMRCNDYDLGFALDTLEWEKNFQTSSLEGRAKLTAALSKLSQAGHAAAVIRTAKIDGACFWEVADHFGRLENKKVLIKALGVACGSATEDVAMSILDRLREMGVDLDAVVTSSRYCSTSFLIAVVGNSQVSEARKRLARVLVSLMSAPLESLGKMAELYDHTPTVAFNVARLDEVRPGATRETLSALGVEVPVAWMEGEDKAGETTLSLAAKYGALASMQALQAVIDFSVASVRRAVCNAAAADVTDDIKRACILHLLPQLPSDPWLTSSAKASHHPLIAAMHSEVALQLLLPEPWVHVGLFQDDLVHEDGCRWPCCVLCQATRRRDKVENVRTLLKKAVTFPNFVWKTRGCILEEMLFHDTVEWRPLMLAVVFQAGYSAKFLTKMANRALESMCFFTVETLIIAGVCPDLLDWEDATYEYEELRNGARCIVVATRDGNVEFTRRLLVAGATIDDAEDFHRGESTRDLLMRPEYADFKAELFPAGVLPPVVGI